MSKEKIIIALGSNLGDRAGNVQRAVSLMLEGGVEVVRLSSLYETEPWGITAQPPFINAAAEVKTNLGPKELLAFLKEIEIRMGREAAVKWGPRLIDLDIIFYGNRIVDENGLVIPHPRAHERAFVMVPVAEIAPELEHPELGKTASALAAGLDKSGIRRAT